MKNVLSVINKSSVNKNKLLAVLIDPDKFILEETPVFLSKINKTIVSHIFVGGSTVDDNITHELVAGIKTHTNLPIILFPGDVTQITNNADAILYLSLLSGRNPDYLIGKHVESVPLLEKTDLEIIPTGYILIDSNNKTTVQRVTNTVPLNSEKDILNTAKAGEYLGMKLIYLEAGSGAEYPVSLEIIKKVKQKINIPLLVGGGIKSKKQLDNTYNAGADLVIIGTAFEKDTNFYKELLK